MNQKAPTLWTRNFIILLFVSLIGSISFSMTAPIITSYSLSIGINLGLAGIVAGAVSLSALMIRPFSGLFSDRFNEKGLIILSSIGTSLMMFGYSISNSFEILMLFRILHGIFFSIGSTASASFAIDFIPEKKMSEGIGYMGMGMVISYAIAPSFGIWMVNNLGYKELFLLATLFPLISSALLLTIPYKRRNRISSIKKFENIIGKEIIFYGIANGFFSLTNGLCSSFLLLLGNERNIGNIGIFFSVSALILVLIRPIAGKLSDSKGPAFVVLIAFFLTGASMVLLAYSTSIITIIGAAVLKSLGQAGGQPALQSICLNKMGPERRGIATSTYYLGADVGQGIGPSIGGTVISSYGYTGMFMGAGGLLFAAMVAFFGYQKLIEKEHSIEANV